MPNTLSIQQINQLDEAQFIQTLGGIFEHSPWVAEQAFASRPFESADALHQTMLDIVKGSSVEQRKTLIYNHPELAGREAAAGELTEDSRQEQAAAGLNYCSPQELSSLRSLNQQYREKYGFPFVIAVKQLTRQDILQALEARLQNSPQQEFDRCIDEIGRIAEFRIHQLIPA